MFLVVVARLLGTASGPRAFVMFLVVVARLLGTASGPRALVVVPASAPYSSLSSS
jgi:hypothetical protein